MALPSPPVASHFDYRTYAPNSSIAAHAHDMTSLTLVLGGTYEERIAGRAAPQREGCALICPRNLPHAQRFGARGARKIIITPGMALLDYLETTTMFSSAPSVRAAPIGKLARQILTERSLDDAFSGASMEGAAWQIAALLGRGVTGASVPASALVRRACRAIAAMDDQPVAIVALCRETGCHPATLNRAFRRELGCTPGDYQRRLRVERAARLLRDTAMPLADVAVACGYCDQSHLARSFRHVMGCTPSEYRRRV